MTVTYVRTSDGWESLTGGTGPQGPPGPAGPSVPDATGVAALQQPAASGSSTIIWKPPDYVTFEDGGASGDGTTNDAAAIVNAYTKAIAQGRSLRATDGKTYAVATRIDLSATLAGLANPPQIALGSATIKQSASTYLFYASATASESVKAAMSAAINAGDQTITLPSGGGAAFGVGNYIAVQCLAGVFGLPGTGGTGNLGYAREIKQVISKSGDVLTVDSPYVFAYPVTATPYSSGNSSYYSKINPLVAPEIIGGQFTNPNLTGLIAGTSNGYFARFEQCKNVRLRDVRADQMGGGVLAQECIGVKISGEFNNLQYQDGSGFYGAPWGYGVATCGCTRDIVCDLTGRAVRHLYTTLGLNFTGANVPGSGGGSDPNSPDGQWYVGGPMHAKIRGLGEGDPKSTAVWDTHPYGYGHDFDVVAVGGVVGLQNRSVRTTGRAVCSGQNGSAGVVHVNTASLSDVTVDVYGVVAPATKAVAIDGTDNVIRGRVRDNGVLGVALAASAVRPLLKGVEIINNTSYGVQDLGSTSPLFVDCDIPKGTSQTVSILNLGATGRIVGGSFLGFGGTGAGLTGINAAALVIGAAVDAGFASTAMYLGAGGAPVGDTPLTHTTTNIIRTSASLTLDKLLRLNNNILISGKTSAQIDTAVNATGIAPADGMIAPDTTNHLIAIRMGGVWYPFTLGAPL